jgi:hypothetical protein
MQLMPGTMRCQDRSKTRLSFIKGRDDGGGQRMLFVS